MTTRPAPPAITWWDRTRIRTIPAVMLVAVLTSVAACGGDVDPARPDQAGSTTRQLEAAATADPSTPEGVAVVALREIFTWNPLTEEPGDSVARARKWLGPSMVRMLDASTGEAAAAKPSLRWAEWAKARAHVEAFTFASGDQAPEDADPAVAQFKIGIEQTVVYPNGSTEALPPSTVIATVVQTTQGWRLDAFR
ncbi:hypothetical protein ACFO5K_05680 [Nocardia halotolerans]|uniref:Mce-associated membrane protein n=1 Tax=Nocardia halotolerans TaxID=1755878 RepID=A0ABV8VEV5_9NOCA